MMREGVQRLRERERVREIDDEREGDKVGVG
jgi:hypothetical protein